LQPVLIFISNSRANIIRVNYIVLSPDILVEIRSPLFPYTTLFRSLTLYAEAGVPEVWLLDPLAKTVEDLKLQGKKYLMDAALAGDQKLTSSQFPGWGLPLIDLFDFGGPC